MDAFPQLREDDVVLDNLPESVAASLEVRQRFLKRLPPDSGGLEFFVQDLQRWPPGGTVRVAFLGGDSALHRDIAEATRAITDACHLTLDFGEDPVTGAFRTWSESDTEYQADIRVSFDKGGFWSLVGTDSIDPQIGSPFGDTGGHAHQRSLNLGGFTVSRPGNWIGVVRHEFLHALAFSHEHQNLRGPCEEAFRWDDDFGYQPTRDSAGRYLPDSEGRRPGIYTYLAGYPNFWSRAKVEHNLRVRDDPDAVAGPFDPASVMLYRFPALFYHTADSPCAPTGGGVELSEGDKRGLRLLYGDRPEDAAAYVARVTDLARAIESVYSDSGLETTSEGETFARSTLERIERLVGG